MTTAKTFLLSVALVLLTYLASANAAQCSDPGCTSCGQNEIGPAPTFVDYGQADCGCQKAGCLKCLAAKRPRLRQRGCGCGTSGGCAQCPKCEGDVCKLELDKGKVKKTCFKTEQVSVCVPKVRFPWQKNCPPGTSETRLVTKLVKHSYECPSCSYKWSVQKAETPSAPETAAPTLAEPTPVYDSYIPQKNAPVPAADYLPHQDIPPAPKMQVAPPTSVIPPTQTLIPQQQPPAPVSRTLKPSVQPWRVQGQAARTILSEK